MYRVPLTCIALATLLTACKGGTTEPGVELKTVDYQCENGATLQVKYSLPDSGPSMATLAYQNKLVPMHQERAASGVLYVADKGQPGYRWHTKGSEGMLMLENSGDGEAETLLKNCVAAEN